MLSFSDIGLLQSLRAQRLGAFDHTYFGVSIENLGALEEEIYEKMKIISRTIKSRDGVADVSRHPEFLKLRRNPKYNIYWRVRAHEKTHFYQHLSMATALSKSFAAGDFVLHLHEAFQDIPPNTKIALPLNAWAAAINLNPENNLAFVLKYLQMRILADIALDGIVLHEHFLKPGKHILQSMHPELKDGFWKTAEYKLGFRALVEGSAKASEWIYYLREEPTSEDLAIEDIYRSPDEYMIALDFLRSHIRGKSIYEYLQALVVLVDFSLHPMISTRTWPYIWQIDEDYSFHDRMPGSRFVRLVDLLGEGVDINWTHKQSIFKYLAQAVQDKFGWPHPRECTSLLAGLVEESIANNEFKGRISENEDFMHPLYRIRGALMARAKDETSFIAPINAPLLMEHHAVPSGFLGSKRVPPTESDLSVMMMSWYSYAMATIMALENFPYCPLMSSPEFSELYRISGQCKQLSEGKCTNEYARTINGWNHLLNCDLFAALMEDILGKDWRGRVSHLLSRQ